MKDFDFKFWTDRNHSADFSEPGACDTRTTAFEKTIRRRNVIEYIAAGLVVALFGPATAAAGSVGLWDYAAGGITVIVGVLFVIWKLARAGSNLQRRPEDSCRAHYRAQLVRQRDLLRGVPAWYLAPLVPGILMIYGATFLRVSREVGFASGLEGVWFPFVATAAFFAFVAWLNLHVARKIDAEIGALDRA
ncbi:hypothetical protein [Erythrobacter sp. SD-21]|uniref:hypothetical protein n=1 Tax=Erythrobacter sp. SD-21 TaxID=161528 RepID=UPI000153F83D|nr:hypothetical protein [Erythrobacter sp. SD-21]EDL50262.1 hypothetical protein ED21_27363 [Erythrobacter sp. SD-21]